MWLSPLFRIFKIIYLRTHISMVHCSCSVFTMYGICNVICHGKRLLLLH
jgi:hypothetical protein